MILLSSLSSLIDVSHLIFAYMPCMIVIFLFVNDAIRFTVCFCEKEKGRIGSTLFWMVDNVCICGVVLEKKNQKKGESSVKQQGPSSISFTKGLNFQALLYFPLNFD
jgi:hypothetical protein